MVVAALLVLLLPALLVLALTALLVLAQVWVGQTGSHLSRTAFLQLHLLQSRWRSLSSIFSSHPVAYLSTFQWVLSTSWVSRDDDDDPRTAMHPKYCSCIPNSLLCFKLWDASTLQRIFNLAHRFYTLVFWKYSLLWERYTQMENKLNQICLRRTSAYPPTQKKSLSFLAWVFADIIFILKIHILFHLLQFWGKLLSWPHPINGQEVFAQEMVSWSFAPSNPHLLYIYIFIISYIFIFGIGLDLM